MISVEEAQKTILSQIRLMGRETVSLAQSLHRIVADPIIAPFDSPSWDLSAMDGYAVLSSDTVGASHPSPKLFHVIETLPAGAMPTKTVHAGEAAKIMTGAPLPPGADAVVRVEDSSGGQEDVAIYAEVKQGESIRFRGEAIRAGDLVLFPGKTIRPYEVAVMASLGLSGVAVYQKPRVAIISTGDELIDLHERHPNKIYNSNGYGLAAQVREAGGVPMVLGIAKDNKEEIARRLEEALSAEMVLFSGGVSMGDFDYVKDVFSESMVFWKVAMKPGKPLAFGMISGRPVFGLPGNPVSAMVTFEQFVRPALLHSMGQTDIFRPIVTAMLEENVTKPPLLRSFLRGVLRFDQGYYHVRTTGDQDSAILMSLVCANGLIVLPEGEGSFKAGELVTVQQLD
jgi:molybdopterin molybdotransferase